MTRGYSGEASWRRSRIVVPVASPAAGSDWALTVPAGHLYQLLAVSAQLVTSATVATRVARLQVSDGNAVFLDLPPTATQAASLTRRYAWAPHAPGLAIGSGILSFVPDLALQTGWKLQTTTDLIDATDAWTAIRVLVADTTVRDGAIDLDTLPDLLVEVVEHSAQE